jgi:hypothetical protein
MSTVTKLSPDPEAKALAEEMMEADEVMRTILRETLDASSDGTITESGRTVCGGSRVLGPINRFPTAVTLPTCPMNRGGTWHTHVTPDQLQRPTNSLPDTGNVVFGDLDVSTVVGTKSAHTIVRSTDQEAMKERFIDAVGIDVDGVAGVSRAAAAGEIDPVAARQRVQSELSDLTFRTRTGFTGFREQVQSVEPPEPGESQEQKDAFTFMALTQQALGAGAGMGNAARQIGDDFERAADRLGEVANNFNVKESAVSTSVGVVVGELVNRLVFDQG